MIHLKSECDVNLVQHCGGDHMVVASAKVCTSGCSALSFQDGSARNDKGEPWGEKDTAGLINYLMKHRHGCYDSQTEVLTRHGWKYWPDVLPTDELMTLDPVTDTMQYELPSRLIRKHYRGQMVQIKTEHSDFMVTPEHNMLAKRRTNGGSNPYVLVPASDFTQASHKVRMGGGKWAGNETELERAHFELLGMFIGDGFWRSAPHTIEFHIRKQRKIDYLKDICFRCGFELRSMASDRWVVTVPEWFMEVVCQCYTGNRDKQIPSFLLSGNVENLRGLWKGLISSDGHVSPSGKITYSTTSSRLADQYQELVLKIGMAATKRQNKQAEGNRKAQYSLTVFRKSKSEPRVGWTIADRKRSVKYVRYIGDVHCATVNTGVLYVRRNGKPAWCGNSPFEHGSMTFYVHAPLFVWREWHRHRIGFSYNEESARYKQLEPVFYLPPHERPMFKVDEWKPGRPKFLPILNQTGEAAYSKLCRNLQESYESAYAKYQENLSLGVDPGLARDCLPVGIFSGCWVTCNPRSMMSFLSLRVHDPAAKFVSYPLYEIDQAARKCEDLFASLYPITHKAFVENGRVAP